MKVNHNNLGILEENVVMEIEWLKEALEILCESKIANCTDPYMRFGLNSRSIDGIYKKKLVEILKGEIIYS